MKKLKFLAFLFLFCTMSLIFSMAVSAAGTSGTFRDSQIKWSYDKTTKTLTLTGNGKSVLTSLDGCDYVYETIIIKGIRHINYPLSANHIYLQQFHFVLPSDQRHKTHIRKV